MVLVETSFERSVPNRAVTCLTAFDALIRRNGPKAIGFTQSNSGTALFPFAVCQLLPPPQKQIIVGWAYKDDSSVRGYPKLISILEKIASERPLCIPDTLLSCIPGAVHGPNNFVRTILASPADVMLWQLMSSGRYSLDDLAMAANIRTRGVSQRLDRYLHAIDMFGAAMGAEEIHLFNRRLDKPASRSTVGRVPVQRIVEAFALTHASFFQASELEEAVVRRAKIGKKETTENWWKSEE